MPIALPPSALRGLLDAAADLALGSSCPGCHQPGWGLCESCRELLPREPHLVVRPTWTQPAAQPAAQPGRRPRPMPPVVAAGWYRPPLSSMVIGHKDDGAWQLAGALGGLLARPVDALVREQAMDVLLVPVPSDRSAVRRRGYDHSRALANAAGRELGIEVVQLLRRTRAADDQVGRSRQDRLGSQRGTMVASGPASVPVIVIDDVVTTGSTAVEAVRALRAARCAVRGVAVICDTPRYATGGLPSAGHPDE